MKAKTFASVVALIILFSHGLWAQEWVVAVVDSPGIRPSIAVDSEGNPHLIYFEYGFGGGAPFLDTTHVMYAVWDPDSGVFVRESTILAAVHPIGELTLDPNDVPHFVFHRHTGGGNATYSTFDGVGWVHDPIISDGHDGFGPSIFLDADNNPHVSFINGRSIDDPDGVGIEYGYFDGSEWTIETVGSEPELSHHSGTSIGLNLTGEPSIAYYDSVGKALMLATRENGVWSIDLVDDIGDPGRFSSMKFDSQGYPRIAYLDKLSTTSGIVRLATMTPSGWTFQNLDTLNSIFVNDSASVVRSRAPVGVEGILSLVLNSTEQVLVAYSDSHKVTLASVNGLEVTKETVFEYAADEAALGMRTSLALDSEDRPHIAFYIDYGDSLGTCMYATRDVVPSDPLAEYGVTYGSTGSGEPNNPGALITIDPLTGDGTLIGPTGIMGDSGPSVPAMAIRSTGEIYGVSASASAGLYTINASTGAGTFVGNTGLSLPNAMAFDGTDVLYVADGSNNLYTMDETTGSATLIGPLGFNVRGIAFDPTDGTMYGSSGTDGIYTIDPTTAASTFVGNTGLGGSTPDIHFDQDGDLFGTKTGAEFISINKVTGTGAIVGPVGFAAVIGLAMRLEHVSISCDDIFFFNAKCNSNGAAQSMVKMIGDFTGATVTFDLDGENLVSSVMSNGTNSIAKMNVPHAGMGSHTVTLEIPAGCYSPVTFNCQVDAPPDPEWDALWAEYDALEAQALKAFPTETTLLGNYPNPFNPSTTFRYGLSEPGQVSLKVYNMLGQLVRTIVDEQQVEGYHEAIWDGRNEVGATVASGIYIYRMTARHTDGGQAGSFVETKRMILMK